MSADESTEITHPGPILRAARDELRLSIDQVADKLHLRPSVVAQIESENYEDFSSDVFLKGYFRSYCRLVGLHEERMVDLLEKQLSSIQSEKKAVEQEASDALSRQKRVHIAKLLTVALSIVVACGLVIWLLLVPKPDSSDVAPDEPQSSEQTSTQDVVQEEPVVQSAQPSAIEDDSSSEDKLDESLQANQSEAVIVVEEKQPASVVVGNSADEVQNIAPQPLNDNVEESDVAQEQNAEQEVAGRNVTIAIDFVGECWFEAYAADGDRITAALKKEGGSFNYQGNTPVRLILGDGRVASMVVDGEPYDFESRIRRSGRAEVVIE